MHKIKVDLKGKTALTSLLIIILVLGTPIIKAVAQPVEETTFWHVTVDVAYDMITDGSFADLVILDVRYQCEYDMGHLYDAVLMPYDELETRIGELKEHKNHEIIVYCRSGYRSQIACEILVDHNFTKVYNMLGGILAWIDAGYPIYTTFHGATVDMVDGEVLLQIEPLLPYADCGCPGGGSCPSCEVPSIEVTVLEEEENRTVILITYEVNGTIFEITITTTMLWRYAELTDEVSRTASFSKIEFTTEDVSIELYSLSYLVQHAEYNLTVSTGLTPLSPETYDASFTAMNYAPAEKSEIISLELVEFNLPATLSQQYAILGNVAKEIGKLYEESGDETLIRLAEAYYTMKEEAKYLSKLVEKQLQEYDREILKSSAILMDLEWDYWECVGECILTWCLFNWLYCEVCWTICQVCFAIPSPATCGPCAACIGAPVAWCLACCLVSPVC